MSESMRQKFPSLYEKKYWHWTDFSPSAEIIYRNAKFLGKLAKRAVASDGLTYDMNYKHRSESFLFVSIR